MLKKEWIDSLKVLAASLLFLLMLPVVMMLDWHVFHAHWELSGIFQPVLAVTVIFYAAYAGISVFLVEKKNRAIEYMLSLPVPIRNIIAVKIFPRLVLLVALVGVGGMFGVFTHITADLISLFIVFFSGLFISLAVESVLNAFIGVILINYILYYTSLIITFLSMKYQLFGREDPIFFLSHILPALVLLVPFAAAFYKTLKHFDAKPLKWQAKYYLKLALPVIAVLLVFILMFLKPYFIWLKLID